MPRECRQQWPFARRGSGLGHCRGGGADAGGGLRPDTAGAGSGSCRRGGRHAGGDLPFKAVIHAVGPRLGDGDEEAKLIRAVQSALRRAAERGWRSVAFPAISAGVFAVPIPICARAYVRAVTDFFGEHPDASLRGVRLCLFQGPLE